jgi:opacity protein-like surface antigen
MIKSRGLGLSFPLVLLMAGFFQPTLLRAEDLPWTFGLRAGIAVPTQNGFTVATETEEIWFESKLGPAVNVQALRHISPMLALGLTVEWERHAYRGNSTGTGIPDAKLGTLNTISLLPTVELRPGRYGQFAPYGTIGIGMNINNFSTDASQAPDDISISPTGALRVGLGTDYFLTDHLALNTELAWKYNYGTLEEKDPDGTFGRLNNNASTLLFLAGLRWR